MAYFISIAEAAESDIREAFLWYEDQQDKLGNIFKDHISKAVEKIQENPFTVQVRYGNTRVFFLKRFPYGIHFQVNEEERSILIAAVFHTSRDSKKWRHRK